MDDMDSSPCKSIYIDFHGKYRRYSGLLENTAKLKSKRFKTDESIAVDSLIRTDKNILNLAFVQDTEISQIEATSTNEIAEISSNVKYNLNIVEDHKELLKQSQVKPKLRGRPRKNKNNETQKSLESDNHKVKASSKIGQKPKVKKELISPSSAHGSFNEFTESKYLKILRTPKHEKRLNSYGFGSEDKEISKTKTVERKRKQRRLSGLYKSDLNTGFIAEQDLYDEEADVPILYEFERGEEESALEESDNQDNTFVTPVKSKLRRRPKKKETIEEIIKYYTDKTVKKKQNNLETIFETPKLEPMSIKKYRRYINFNERMSSVKIKKRNNKIVKYNLWQNTDQVSMDYFVRKIEEVEEVL